MNRGGHTTLLLATIGLSGCVAARHEVEVRPIANPAAKLVRGDDLAVARGQLALGNVGLALEAFRKVQRVRPSDLAPLEGIADCYMMMGRFDLSQSNLEAALALAPRDPRLLLALARIFDLSGQSDRAAQARADAQDAGRADTPAILAKNEPARPQSEVLSNSITMTLPPARAVEMAQVTMPPRKTVAIARPVVAEPQRPAPAESAVVAQLSEARPAPIPETPLQSDVAQMEQLTPSVVSIQLAEQVQLAGPNPFAAPIAIELPPVELASSALPPELAKSQPPVALAEPAATPVRQQVSVEPRAPAVAARVARPAPPPAPPRPEKSASSDVALRTARPRLERIAPGEVALITTGQPMWKTTTSRRLASASPVHWIPLTPISSRPNVVVLNAARSQGLAASARSVLVQRGWRKINIGNAPRTLTASVVYYPQERAALGRRLAAQFGIKAKQVGGKQVVLVLGRDKIAAVRGKRSA